VELTIFAGAECALNLGVLTGTTSLFFVSVIEFNTLSDCFTVFHLRRAGFNNGLELTLHAFNVNLKVKLTHTTDDGVSGFIIMMSAEGGIFAGETTQSLGHVVGGLVISRFHSQTDHGLGNVHA